MFWWMVSLAVSLLPEAQPMRHTRARVALLHNTGMPDRLYCLAYRQTVQKILRLSMLNYSGNSGTWRFFMG